MIATTTNTVNAMSICFLSTLNDRAVLGTEDLLVNAMKAILSGNSTQRDKTTHMHGSHFRRLANGL
jgi:hypothetical protein